MNSVNLIGNIGHDLELRHTKTGKAVLNLSIAVSDYNDKTEWFRVVIWNQQAENTVKYCSKGSKIGITGRLSTNEYTDNQGQKRTNVEVVAQSVEFLSYENNQQANSTPVPNSQNNQGTGQSNAGYRYGQGSGMSQPQTSNPATNVIDDDPFQSSDVVADISDDDLPFDFAPMR